MHLTSTEELLQKYLKHPYLSTDSRKVMPGSLFFALKGENFNANTFAAKALENGASYAIIDDPEYCTGTKTLLVENVLASLQDLASLYRATLKIPIIAITGTNGKTTTKELIATALSARFNTVATHGNFNNHIGVPLTLLSIKPETEIAVVEMGANHPGEIDCLCQIARPTHGLITNIGKAHLEGFGSFEGVKKTKKELYNYLNEHGGTVFVNSGNDLLMQFSSTSNRVTYGKAPSDSVSGFLSEAKSEKGIGEIDFISIELQKPTTLKVATHLTGNYNFENVMAAICIANHFRVDLNQMVEAIGNYQPQMNRSQVVKSEKNTLILDAYNANPSSMKVAIDNFCSINAGNKVVIVGDMFELGDDSEIEHEGVIRMLTQAGFDQIYTAGKHFYKASENIPTIKRFLTTEQLKQALTIAPITQSTILIKGSRGMKLEIITEVL